MNGKLIGILGISEFFRIKQTFAVKMSEIRSQTERFEALVKKGNCFDMFIFRFVNEKMYLLSFVLNLISFSKFDNFSTAKGMSENISDQMAFSTCLTRVNFFKENVPNELEQHCRDPVFQYLLKMAEGNLSHEKLKQKKI